MARLFGPAIFQSSKLKVLFVAVNEKKYPPKLLRTYTLTQSDFTDKLTLAIFHSISNSQLQGCANKIYIDEVVAEWKKVKGNSPQGLCTGPCEYGVGNHDVLAVWYGTTEGGEDYWIMFQAATYPYFPGQEPTLTGDVEFLLKNMEDARVDGALIVQPINHKFDHSLLTSVLTKYPSKFVGCCLANPAEDGSQSVQWARVC